MATSAPRTTNRNGARDKYFGLGTDGEGVTHTYRTTDRAVIAVDEDGEREVQRCLKPGALNEYMTHIAKRRGWERRSYGRSLGALLADGLEAGQ